MTIRNMIYDWMDIPRDSAVLPDPLPMDETGERAFWLEDPRDKHEILRPAWTDSWNVNESGWARFVADAIRRDGARWNPNARQTELESLTVSTVVQAIRVSFSSWVKAYKKSKKPAVDQSTVRQKQWRNTRKTTVSQILIIVKEAIAYRSICRKRRLARDSVSLYLKLRGPSGHS